MPLKFFHITSNFCERLFWSFYKWPIPHWLILFGDKCLSRHSYRNFTSNNNHLNTLLHLQYYCFHQIVEMASRPVITPLTTKTGNNLKFAFRDQTKKRSKKATKRVDPKLAAKCDWDVSRLGLRKKIGDKKRTNQPSKTNKQLVIW